MSYAITVKYNLEADIEIKMKFTIIENYLTFSSISLAKLNEFPFPAYFSDYFFSIFFYFIILVNYYFFIQFSLYFF